MISNPPAADYFQQKYGITKTHSAVVSAVEHVKPCKVLDLGCGQGRNTLFLGLLGFDVTASDYNPSTANVIHEIANTEGFKIKTEIYDMNQASIGDNYDFIVATVVFMFLEPQQIPTIVANMQEKTNPGGHNLIVSAMNTKDFPCHMPFSFTFTEGELAQYYQGWDLLIYEEEVGSMHARDAAGNPIKLKFVTMLAKKQAE
ncbi:tellurite resistance methyltransferase TehB [Candidatus Nitrosacidococcus sp. I8]|uniref:tellurite resistance methyltransferase TehB n=1 Tax=Candidatus Nitrosacidococcus sp. I8 TaxID=2942908 RepID=UPI002226D13A|nr:tellurite resistance methyltransferase TehB [Candidatus Nitrosacidococcus sp. I8]CAH9017549.1 putative S-adenosyl-L-methionine-dependent methyltransferase TehB [Candidatus Nitrosacidococcus sp. I8]